MALPAIQGTGYHFRRILSYFPQDISLAFAYGSAVFKQIGAAQSNAKNMVDFVFAVDDPITWHTMNLMQNRSHYSVLKYLGPKKISTVQNKYGAGVYYNTLVPCDGKVKILLQKENGRLQTALTTNLKSALTASFLMLPESFTEEDLYLQIAGLSYSGDFRMIIGEDKAKVLNIVRPNLEHFRKLYSNILQECPQAVYKQAHGKIEVDKSPEGQFLQLMSLPKHLQQNITYLVDQPGRNRDVEEVLLQVAQDPDCGNVVQQALFGIVKSSSLSQSAKGVVTAGVKKTISYSAKKLYKMVRSLRKQ
ncbi:hypothetical protein GDO81_018238 [Engystomops pustulosus]|uniref:Phosphatidate cytidylyltransferase, mitochondrial n=1 Tax=Engystomops pustulosus TaxID=76066 RepID=A0AAV7A5I3_ENGPU|nr:hypothetical protein GDO81_018238 [Engystomops pustulosus]